MTLSTLTILQDLLDRLRLEANRSRQAECRSLARQLKAEATALLSVLAPPPKGMTKLARAKLWLIGQAGTVPQESRGLFLDGREQGFSTKTLRRALREMGATYIHRGRRRKRRVLVSLPKILGNSLATYCDLATNSVA